jgi:hypothetical protein
MSEYYTIRIYKDRIVVIGSVPVDNLIALTKFAEHLGFDGMQAKRDDNESFSFVKLQDKSSKGSS